MPLQHWLQLSLTDGIGPVLSRRLITACGSIEMACSAGTHRLQQVDGIGSSKASKIAAALRAAAGMAVEANERALSTGVTILCPEDEVYPSLLHTIPDPPLVLYVRGTIEPRDLHSLAIVGSRKCSFYGREQAERFGALLAGAGMTVISGGARGIDSASHRGAMSHPEGRTIAVLGSGVNVAYPPENSTLFDEIAKRGAVLSEYPFDTPPVAENFPRRNRIVSGMARGVLVIEADERSGALITARQACDDHGRPVFALPGRVDNQLSAGPHLLIRDGATLVTKLDDIIENLGPLPLHVIDAEEPMNSAPASAELPDLSVETSIPRESLNEFQLRVLEQLSSDPAGVDEIVDRSNLEISIVLRELTFLSLNGLVRRVDGQNFVLASRRK